MFPTIVVNFWNFKMLTSNFLKRFFIYSVVDTTLKFLW